MSRVYYKLVIYWVGGSPGPYVYRGYVYTNELMNYVFAASTNDEYCFLDISE